MTTRAATLTDLSDSMSVTYERAALGATGSRLSAIVGIHEREVNLDGESLISTSNAVQRYLNTSCILFLSLSALSFIGVVINLFRNNYETMYSFTFLFAGALGMTITALLAKRRHGFCPSSSFVGYLFR